MVRDDVSSFSVTRVVFANFASAFACAACDCSAKRCKWAATNRWWASRSYADNSFELIALLTLALLFFLLKCGGSVAVAVALPPPPVAAPPSNSKSPSPSSSSSSSSPSVFSCASVSSSSWVLAHFKAAAVARPAKWATTAPENAADAAPATAVDDGEASSTPDDDDNGEVEGRAATAAAASSTTSPLNKTSSRAALSLLVLLSSIFGSRGAVLSPLTLPLLPCVCLGDTPFCWAVASSSTPSPMLPTFFLLEVAAMEEAAGGTAVETSDQFSK
mmetsp:Transcript_24961/g.51281  ORF Transcript_24961/g.51281 Transcript_24961/m.51281 type:complete len:274 (-) Transcript_24961:152-973(-)